MNSTPREDQLALVVLDLLLAGLGLVFVARATLRKLSARISPRRRYEN